MRAWKIIVLKRLIQPRIPLTIVVVMMALAVPHSHSFGQGLDRKQSELSVKERRSKRSASSEKVTGPRISRAALIASTIEVRLIKGISKTLMQMRNIVKKLPPKSPQKLEVMKKMLQLQLEQAAFITSKEHEKYEQKWNKWIAAGKKGPEPQLVHTNSSRMWQKFIRLSKALAKEYPKHPELDKVYYNLSLGLQFLERHDESAKVLTNLIKKFPNSPIAGDAYYSLGDYYFDKNNFKGAEKNYLKVIHTYKQSKRYLWSMFKLGWTYYNQNNYQRAATYWKQTVARAKSGDKSAQLLRDEALRDLVLALAEIGDIPAAVSYFRANGDAKHVGNFLNLLANTLIDQGKIDRAIEVLKKIQTVAPTSPEAPKSQSTLIVLAYELGNYKMLWRELRLYAVKYSKTSPWAKANAANERLILETEKDIRDLMLYQAKITHKNAQKQKSTALMAEAAKGYQLFLTHFPKAKQFYEVTFNLADLYYFQKKYTLAGRLYLDVTSVGKKQAVIFDENGKPIRNIHRQSTEYMLDSFYKAYEPELKKIQASKEIVSVSSPKKPLSSKASNFIKACGTFLETYPNDKKIKKNCHVYIAETYRRHNHRQKALKYLWIVAKAYPGSKHGEKAVESLIPLYAKDRKSLNLAVLQLMKIPEYQQGKIGDKLRGLLRGVNEETVAGESDHIKRAKGFLKLASESPNYPDAYKYYFNAAEAFEKGKDFPSAVKSYRVVATKFKNVPQAETSLLKMAEISAILMDYDNALKYFKKYARDYPNSKKTSKAVEQSCNLSIVASHSPTQIVRDCQLLARSNPGAYNQTLSDLITTTMAQRNTKSMDALINQYIRSRGVSPTAKIAALHKMFIATGRSTNSPYANQILNLYLQNRAQVTQSQDPGGRIAAAEIVFLKAVPLRDRYHQGKLRGGTITNMQQSIEQKAASLTALDSTYRQVIDTRDPIWGVAALYEIGRAWERFGDLYSNPPGIKGAKIEDVKKQLAPSARQAYNKALTTYRTAQNDASKNGVYTNYSRLVSEAIGRRSGKKLSTSDWVLLPDFLGSPITPKFLSSTGP